jgi:DegT/DnrJ/EryC1/StrS aminotransferase family
VQELEERFAAFQNVKHCVAVASGTAGLQLAARALGMRGEILMPAFTFVGTAHALAWIGLRPIFCDVSRATHTLDPQSVERAITSATGGILGTHLWGQPCDIGHPPGPRTSCGELACRGTGFLDADEFWVPAFGSLRNCHHLLEADVLSVDRYNVGLTSQQRSMPVDALLKTHADLLLFTRMPEHFRQYVEDYPEVPFITLMPGPKVMARPHAIGGIAPGSHSVPGRSADASIRRFAAPDMLIAHVAFSTAERFRRKLDNIRMELAENPACYDGDGELAWHWKRWAAMADRDADQEFARQMFDDNALSRLRQSGVLRSAQEIFAERRGVDANATLLRPV